MSKSPQKDVSPARLQQDYQSGNLAISSALVEAYNQFPEAMRTVLEHGKRSGQYVFCTEEELQRAPERFGISSKELSLHQEAIEQYGSFFHEGKEFIVPSSPAAFAPVLRWIGLSALLQELRINPKDWQQAVLNDLGLSEKGVPVHLVDELPLRTQYAPAIIKSLRANLGITCTPEMIDHKNPRQWLQMTALNAVATGDTRGRKISTALPETTAFYEQLLKRAQARVEQIEDASLSGGQVLARAYTNRGEEGKARSPRFFTEYPEERTLLLNATRIVEQCLKKDPSKYKFRCRLSSAKNQYAITMVLGNGRDAPEEYILQTRAGDLDHAIALKKALQSHILNRADIEPLRYGYLENSSELRQNEIIPYGLKAPEKAEVRRGFYIARFTGEEKLQDGSTRPVEMVFPLGLRADPEDEQGKERIVQNRIAWLESQMNINEYMGKRETLDELTARMRREVIGQLGAGGWKEQPAVNLQGLEPGERIDLNFPRSIRGQTTRLGTVAIQYVDSSGRALEGGVGIDAEGSHNPTWQLKFTLYIDGNGKEYKYQPSIKLQTSNEQAALRKAELILTTLQDSFAALGARNELPYSELRWNMGGAAPRGQIQVTDSAGAALPAPEPHYLSDFVDDVVTLVKSDFHIKATEKHIDSGNSTHFVLSAHRGYGPEQDEKPYKDTDNRPLARSFIAPDSATMNTFCEAVNTTFREAITETYSTRAMDKEGVLRRKSLQKFNDHTIDNHFKDAITTQLENPKFAGKVTLMQRASGIAGQERNGRNIAD